MKAGSWVSILSMFLFGVAGAATVSKLIPLGADLTAAFGLDAAQFGWLISLVALPAALLSIPAGVLVDRYGPRPVLYGALTLGVVSNLVSYHADSLLMLQVARFIEGGAICHIYTAAPAFLIATNEGPRRATAMTLWATYMPIGSAVGLLLAGQFAGSGDWHDVFLGHGALLVAIGLLNLRQPRVGGNAGPAGMGVAARVRDLAGVYSRPAMLLFAAAFFLVISVGFGTNASLPGYLASLHETPVARVSQLVAFATLLMIPGSLGVGMLLAKGVAPGRVFTGIAIAGMVVGGLTFWPVPGGGARAVLVAAWFIVSGASVAAVMAILPQVAEPQRRGAAAALLSLAGALATFATAPIWLPLAAGGNWPAIISLMVGSWAIALIVMVSLTRGSKGGAK